MENRTEKFYLVNGELVTRKQYDAWLKKEQGFTDQDIYNHHVDLALWEMEID